MTISTDTPLRHALNEQTRIDLCLSAFLNPDVSADQLTTLLQAHNISPTSLATFIVKGDDGKYAPTLFSLPHTLIEWGALEKLKVWYEHCPMLTNSFMAKDAAISVFTVAPLFYAVFHPKKELQNRFIYATDVVRFTPPDRYYAIGADKPTPPLLSDHAYAQKCLAEAQATLNECNAALEAISSEMQSIFRVVQAQQVNEEELSLYQAACTQWENNPSTEGGEIFKENEAFNRILAYRDLEIHLDKRRDDLVAAQRQVTLCCEVLAYLSTLEHRQRGFTPSTEEAAA